MKLNNLSIKDFSIKEFIIGGVLFSLIKYTANNVDDIRISSMIAAFPIGLLSSLLISDKKIKDYSLSYATSIFILLLTSIVFYLLHALTELQRPINLILSILFWIVINFMIIHFT
jgi:hypothetical protein|tara:strand:+ start:405 stop:749 length:345 start_codon:yes stop_codon:yes gene_type:complete